MCIFFWWSFLFACFAVVAVGQSSDIAWPSPVRSTEIRATIPARDLGDPRLTDHYYAFTGVPGDVLITVDSSNLNGDIDVFTFSGLRPLLKFTVYAGSSTPITKGIYLRQREDLILRIEGRTPNDDEAVYRIHFGGAFEPITSGPLAEHEDALQLATPAEATNKTGRRVSSVGARVEEPRTEVAEVPAPTPEPTPEVSALPEPKVPAARSTTRNSRRRVPAARRRPAPSVKSSKPDETAKKEIEETSSTETSATETARVPKPPTSKSRRARKPATPVAIPEPDSSGPRLIIETSDGTLVDRFMGSVRRVTVENGQVIVIGKDGTIQRIPLASVVRMTIAP
ncbi:MAG TPA: hypothetical protein VMZ30_17890 [Pyrinomonadaceae bacterium]|nr:hypothetical protein [Pyrinomonadaceae bacterium]